MCAVPVLLVFSPLPEAKSKEFFMSGNALFPNLKFSFLTRQFVFSLSVFLSLLACHVSAHSAETVSGSDSLTVLREEAVVVMASRLPGYGISYDKITNNTTVKTEEDLELIRPRSLQEALKDSESVILYDNVGNGVDAVLGLRGFTESSAMIVLVDGVRVNEVDGDTVNYPLIPFHQVDSIEVKRGSDSPIYGNNAFGGVINIKTREASEKKLSLFGGFEYSSFKGFQFDQGFSGTLADEITPLGGKFKYYFDGGRNISNGFRDNGEWRITSFDTKLSYELPEEDGQVFVHVKHADDATSNPGSLTFDQYQADPAQTIKPLDGRDMKSTTVAIGADKKFFDERITASVLNSYRTNLIHFYTTTASFTDGSFNPDTDLVTQKSRATDLIWQLAYDDVWGEVANHSLLGMEFRDGSYYGLEQDAFGGNVVETSPRESDRGAELSNVGLFWNERLEFFERLSIHAGMRHDFSWIDIEDALVPSDSLSKRWRKSTVSAGAAFNVTGWMDLFGNYSEGFRVPNISELIPFSGTLSSDLKPEQSQSYEIGSRVRYDDLARLKFSYFLIDLEDEILYDSTAISVTSPFGRNINAAKSRRTGIELRFDTNPIPEIAAYFSYAWTKAFVREINPQGNLVDGRSLGQVPENRMTFGLNAYPFKRAAESLAGLRFSLYGTFTGKQHPASYESTGQTLLNSTGGAGHVIKSYTLWDLMLAYEWKNQNVYFKVNNLFDNKYYTNSVSATGFGTAILPAGSYAFVNPGAPREYVVGMRYEF